MKYAAMYHGENCVGLAKLQPFFSLETELGKVHRENGRFWQVKSAFKAATGQVRLFVEPTHENNPAISDWLLDQMRAHAYDRSPFNPSLGGADSAAYTPGGLGVRGA